MRPTKHTPGPWSIEQSGLPNAAIVGTFCLEKVQVCGEIANAADATLIAAAPALLATLEALLVDDSPSVEAWAEAWAAVDAATGRSRGGEG